MRVVRLFGALALAAAAACGPSGVRDDIRTQPSGENPLPDDSAQGTATWTGGVQGHTMRPRSASFARITIDNQVYLILSIADQPDQCDLFTAGQRRSNSNDLLFMLYVVDQAAVGEPIVNGTYAIFDNLETFYGAGGYGAAQFSKRVEDCTPALSLTADTAQSGLVTLTDISEATVRGTYDLRVGAQGDVISGQFTAVPCVGLTAAATNSDAKECQTP